MANHPRQRILGLCLDEKTVRLAEVERILGRYKVINLTEVASQTPFTLDTLQNSGSLEQFSQNLYNAISEYGYAAEEACIAVNSRHSIVKHIPFEPSLSPKELAEHVVWELEQYIISPLEEYTFDFQTFSTPPESTHPNLLLVAIRKIVLDAIESIFEDLDLQLRIVTVDILATINTIEYNYNFTPDEKIAVVEIGEDDITITLLEGLEYVGFNSFSFKELGGSQLTSDPESLMTHLSKQLRFLFLDHWSDSDKSTFDHVLLTRNTSSIEIEPLLQTTQQNSAQIIQPFRKIALSENLQESLDQGNIYAEYMGAIGATIFEE